MQVKAQEVFNSEMMSKISRKRFEPSQSVKDAKARRIQAWKDAAIRRFPGIPDWEAFDRQREWDADHQ